MARKIKKVKKNKDDSKFPRVKKGKSVAVIGGGITGIQAALDLASAGVKTYLVEKSPSLGGRMAQLDKTFPTMDCSI